MLSLPLNIALARERFRSVGCKASEVAGGAPGITSCHRHSDRDSAGKMDNSSFSVWRMTVTLAFTPICSPTRTLCK
jgi:hypothetical protein